MAGDSYQEGLAVRRQVLGDTWVDRTLASKNAFNSEFQEMITRHVWGDVWTRPGIDRRTRRFMVLSTMIALGRWEEFRLHVRTGLATGDVSREDIKEIILQATVYCGAPAGNHAMHEAQLAFDEQ